MDDSHRMSKLEFWWDMILLGVYPIPVLWFYWMYNSEHPFRLVMRNWPSIMGYLICGVGTLVFVCHWCLLMKRYPKSKGDSFPCWYGAVQSISLTGIWVTFIACHLCGIPFVLWCIWSALKSLLKRTK